MGAYKQILLLAPAVSTYTLASVYYFSLFSFSFSFVIFVNRCPGVSWIGPLLFHFPFHLFFIYLLKATVPRNNHIGGC